MAVKEIASLKKGTNLNGFRIQSVLNRGGFGITYMGVEIKTGRKVVIKENIPGKSAYRPAGELAFRWDSDAPESGSGSRQWSEQNFLKEANSLAALKHPNIVPVLAAFRAPATGSAYIVMPYVSSCSLFNLVQNQRPDDKDWVGYVLASMLSALRYMHSKNTIHRDIKPDNIIIAEDGRPVLIDFGSARLADSEHLTRIATAEYAPIEQQRGEKEGPWTDIYSLGATMYRVITGKHVPNLLERSRPDDAYVPLVNNRELVALYGVVLLSSIDKALAFQPEDRYPSAMAWLNDVARENSCQCVMPVSVPGHLLGSRNKFEEKEPPRTGLRLLAALLSLALLLLIGGLGGYFFMTGEGPKDSGATVVLVKQEGVDTKKDETKTEDEQETGALPEVKKTPLRVLARPMAHFYDAATGTLQDTTKSPAKFGVYYVEQDSVKEDEDFYRVSMLPEEEVVGALKKSEVYVWPHNLLVRYGHGGMVTKAEDDLTAEDCYAVDHGAARREQALYFDNPSWVYRYVVGFNENERKDLVKNIRHAHRAINEDKNAEEPKKRLNYLVEHNGVVAIEPESWDQASYEHLLPVLGYARSIPGGAEAGEVRDLFNYTYKSSAAIPTGILKVAAMNTPPQENKAQKDPETQKGPETQDSESQKKNSEPLQPFFDFVFVIDTTKSMKPYMEATKRLIGNFIDITQESIGSQGDTCRYGYVAYRDTMYDDKGNVVVSSEGFSPDPKRSYPAISFTEAEGVSALVSAEQCEEWIGNLKEAGSNGDKTEDQDFHEDLPAALELLCKDSFPWRTKKDANGNEVASIRVVIVVGDAGFREPGEKESDSLRFKRSRADLWERRMAGSQATMSAEELRECMLVQKHLYTLSVHVTPDKATYGKKVVGGEQAWEEFDKKTAKQFYDFSVCYVKAPPKSLNNEDTAPQIFEQVNSDVKDMVKVVYAAVEEQQAKVKGDVSDNRKDAETLLENSGRELGEAVKDPNAVLDIYESDLTPMQRVFRAAYVDWLAGRPSTDKDKSGMYGMSAENAENAENAEIPPDMVGWTIDTPDNGVPTIKPMMVLTKEQLVTFTQTLQDIREMLQNTRRSEAKNPTAALAGRTVANLKDPNAPQTELTEEQLRAEIDRLPYRSTLLNEIQADHYDIEALDARLAAAVTMLGSYLDKQQNRSATETEIYGDLIFIPIEELP